MRESDIFNNNKERENILGAPDHLETCFLPQKTAKGLARAALSSKMFAW